MWRVSESRRLKRRPADIWRALRGAYVRPDEGVVTSRRELHGVLDVVERASLVIDTRIDGVRVRGPKVLQRSLTRRGKLSSANADENFRAILQHTRPT